MKSNKLPLLVSVLLIGFSSCGLDLSAKPAVSLSKYFTQCNADMRLTQLERDACGGYVKALQETTIRPLFAIKSTPPAGKDVVAFAKSHILYPLNNQSNLETGSYRGLDGSTHSIECINNNCTFDGQSVASPSAFQQSITDGEVYIKLAPI